MTTLREELRSWISSALYDCAECRADCTVEECDFCEEDRAAIRALTAQIPEELEARAFLDE